MRLLADMASKAQEAAFAAHAEARAATAQLLVAQANVAALSAEYLGALRCQQVVCVRGALDALLGELGVEATAAALAKYFEQDTRGAAVLDCCNTVKNEVSRDHFNKPHTAQSLAQLLLRVRERLNNDAHVKMTGKECSDSGDQLVMEANGLSEAQVQVLQCLFSAHAFPVRVVSGLWPLGSDAPE